MIKIDLVQVPRVGFKFKITGIAPGYLNGIYTYNQDSGLTNPDPLVVRQILNQFGENNCLIHPQIKASYEAYCKTIQGLHYTDVDLDSYNWGDVRLTMKQVAAVHFMKSAGHACIVADEAGLGKTLSTLALTREMDRVLVVSPKTAKDNWHYEAEKWELNGQLVVIHGTTKAVKQKRLDKAISSQIKYISIHYDMLEPEKYPALFSTKWGCILFDEAHYLKSREQRDSSTGELKAGRKHAAVKKLKADKKVFMTGTPFTNNAADCWTMLNLIDPKRFGSYWTFAKQFALVEDGYFGTTVKSMNARYAEDLKWVLSRYMIRRDKEIESKKVFEYHNLNFGESQKKIYEDAKKHYIYGDNIIESDIEKFIRMLQISTDPMILGIDAPSVTNDKILELVDAHKEKIIIGCVNVEHVVNLNRILAATGRNVFVVTGEAKNKKAIVDSFKQSGGDSILIATITSITESLSIDECHTMILSDLTFSPTKNWQFFNRIHRLTSTIDKKYHILVTEDVNQYKQELLQDKQEMINCLMRGKPIAKHVPDDLQKHLMGMIKNKS